MNTITVNASKIHEIRVGSDLLATVGEEAARLKGVKKVCVVSDSTVFPLYGSIVLKSLRNAGLDVASYVFPAGEASKTGATYLSLLNTLAENQLTRSDLIVALGGGVVGDLAGFAAATFLRGIRLIQLPTTLLAAVDSSVGGKTAIDLPAGKNLAGAFYQPNLVLCDTDTLNTITDDVFRDGCAEVIKYGILYDPSLFRELEEAGIGFNRERVITRCIELKKQAVEADEFDTGARMKLNLGHTVGHGIETQSHFSISHGCAVAIGTAIVARAAVAYALCSQNETDRIISLLLAFGLPVDTDFSPEQLLDSALSDKKRTGNTVNLIIPRSIGECSIVPTSVEDLVDFIKAGL